MSVSRVAWSPDGNYVGTSVSLFHRCFVIVFRLYQRCMLLSGAGAAFSKHLIHLYAYSGANDLRQHLEVSEYYSVCFSKMLEFVPDQNFLLPPD